MIQAQQQQPAPAPFQSASLYVGDLHFEVTEGVLFELFNTVGPVASIRVCRDAVTRRSLGYAYVNFHNVQDAERALDTMNFNDIKGKPCRIMWSQRDPSLRKSGLGNIFVKNLAPSVDNKGLFDTFSVFGNILSCKVATDGTSSKGYGYVHYETAEAAQDAINKFNGSFLDDIQVSVLPFVRRQERIPSSSWTNLYVKQFPKSWGETELHNLFEPYGKLVSVKVEKELDGTSKGFGFVNFEDHAAAEKALNDLQRKEIVDPTTNVENGDQVKELYINQAQKKDHRTREIKQQKEQQKEERVSKFQGMNLYVKNLDDSVTDEIFKETFAKFGTITSARIMRDPGDNTSKGFGFVCYSSPEEATRAVQELNGVILRSKPIMVTLHQRKELRRAHLAATYAPRNMRYPANVGPVPLPYLSMYVQGQPGGFPQPRPFYPGGQPPQQQYQPRGSPRGLPPQYAGRGAGPGAYYQMHYQQQLQQGGLQQINKVQPGGLIPGQRSGQTLIAGPNGQPVSPTSRRIGMPPQQQPRGVPPVGVPRPYPQGQPMSLQQQQQQQGIRAGPGVGGGVKFNPNVRNHGLIQQQIGLHQAPQQHVQPVGLAEPLDDHALAAADPQMQKNMIGERLYPLIFQHKPALAGKITGMLLEMDNAELLNLIESPDALSHKIDEAMLVLQNHQSADE